VKRRFEWRIALVSLVLSICLWWWVREEHRRVPPDCPYPTDCSRISLDRFKQCVERRERLLGSKEEENGIKPLDSEEDPLE